jgi:hypothetical protein
LKAFLSSQYNSQTFELFLQERFHSVDIFDSSYTDVDLNETEKQSIKAYSFIGKAELDDGKEIGFFEFISKSPNIENKRVGYNAILKKLAYDEYLDGAIASFHHPQSDAWRLSFVGFEYDEGRANVTNLKRYTYVLGKDVPIQTPLEQLSELKYPTIDEIKDIFSVERVSKEFFEKYKNLYLELSEYLQSQIAFFGDQKNINLFTKKLLGRVVFLYFIQKKGWIGSKEEWGTGNKKFLSNCFASCNYDNFYFDILHPIFFEALNQKRENDYFELLDCKMPFLNGGLFSKDEFDNMSIIIENSIFEAIFSTFDQYNFTIIEDSPNDSEIAIDPEMLGRVFESLLEDRKEKGAFYTPREIVHYMSRNTLELYLKTEAKDYNYLFSIDDFLHKTSLDDNAIIEFHTQHPVKFIKIDDYFEALSPYRNLIVDFYIVVKIRGLLLDKNANRTRKKKGHPEITADIWHKIFKKEYTTVAINFGTNKEIRLKKSYKYPTILKYIQIEDKFFALAFLPNIWGDLELNTIFPIREKNIKSRLRKFDKPLHEITRDNFAFDENVYEEIEALREDCRSLHAEPLHQGAELSRQAVVQKGLSTFRNTFALSSLSDVGLKELLKDKDYYQKTINKLLNDSTLSQHKLKDIMLKKLKQIKVLDPAIGSGAFPMGILHELISLRRHLGDTTNLVQLKKEIIENSIYGIDIENSAVEIAKLRFWLSIVVDEETPTPLPNLYYKIMVGNSLIETINGFDPLDIQDSNLFGDSYKINALQDKFHAYYKEWDNDKKIQIQNEIDKIIEEVLDSKLEKHQDEIDSYLKNADIFSIDKKITKAVIKAQEDMNLIAKVKQKPTTELFFYKLYFAEVINSGGFNVIIGNPPYVRQEKIKDLKPRLKIENYQSYNGTADLYIYFFEKGYKLLKQNGILSYITSNKYTRAKYGKEFRKFILDNTDILEYIDFNGVKVFESATVDTSILSYQKSHTKDNVFVYCDIDEHYKKGEDLERFIAQNGFEYNQSDLSIESFSFSSPQELVIKKRVEEIGIPLKEWNVNIYRGILTGYNEAFIIDGETKDELIKKDPKSSEIIKPLLKGRDIKRYSYEFADKWLIGAFPALNLNIDDYPAIKEYLERFLPKLKQTGETFIDANNKKQKCRKKTGNKWFETQDQIAYWQEFEKEKIVFSKASKNTVFYFDKNNFYFDVTAYMITGNNLKYLISLFNSNFIKKIFYKFYSGGGIDGEITIFTLKELPIPQIPKENQKPFEILVDYISWLKAKEQQIDNYVDNKHITKLFEDVIDAMVLELYFEEEMKEADFSFIAHATKLFKPIDSLSDAQVQNIIFEAYQALREKDNPIQNDLQLLPIRVPMVAPILESI